MLTRYIKLLIICLLATVAAACTDRIDLPRSEENEYGTVTVDGDNIILNVTLDIPEMADATSRSFADSPDYNQLHLYLIEFDDNGSPVTNPLTRVYQAEQETVEGNIVKFRVQLSAADKPKVLHLIAVPKNEELNIGYGLEANIIPHLGVSYGTDAYWRRIEFPDGYCSEAPDGTWAPDASLIQKLTRVQLIRNFAKISISCTDKSFTFKGFAIMNIPQAGTIAPWNSKTLSFPEYLDASGKPLSYNDLKPNYSGILPAGTNFDNQVAGGAPEMGGTAPQYLYERPYSRDRSTFIIICGLRNGKMNYYKLDIGKPDADGVFRHYNLLRNFNYNITLTKVEKDGYSSALEAINGMVSNNFSFALDTSNLLNISDGKQIIYVSSTYIILTDTEKEETITFRYRYTNLADKKYYNDDDNVYFSGLEPGPVIKSATKAQKDDAQGYREITIVCHKASSETKTQEFTIVNRNGLGRTITMTLHEKWPFSNLLEYGATLADWKSNSPNKGMAAETTKAPMTIFFDLPNNLPEAVFPLTFLLECQRQDIENDPNSNMVVTEGESFFPENKGQNRIKYKKTITLTNYNTDLDPNNTTDQGTIIYDADGNISTHRVRCHMRTVRALSDMNVAVGASIYDKVWIQDVEGNFIADGKNNVVTFKRTRTK